MAVCYSCWVKGMFIVLFFKFFFRFEIKKEKIKNQKNWKRKEFNIGKQSKNLGWVGWQAQLYPGLL